MLLQVSSQFKLCIVLTEVLFPFTLGAFEINKTISSIVNEGLSSFCSYFKVFQYITVNVINGKAVSRVDNSLLRQCSMLWVLST